MATAWDDPSEECAKVLMSLEAERSKCDSEIKVLEVERRRIVRAMQICLSLIEISEAKIEALRKRMGEG